MAAFLQRLSLPRLVHFLDMILPQWSQCSPLATQGGDLRRLSVSQNVLQEVSMEWNPPNVVKPQWSRSGIVHVAIARDHKPLLLPVASGYFIASESYH